MLEADEILNMKFALHAIFFLTLRTPTSERDTFFPVMAGTSNQYRKCNS
jgi:hypothetical protein